MYQGNLVNVSRVKKNTTQLVFPVDTERKLNVHKTFRRRPGRIGFCIISLSLQSYHPEVLYQKRIFKNSLENTLLKSDSDTCIFLRVLRNI